MPPLRRLGRLGRVVLSSSQEHCERHGSSETQEHYHHCGAHGRRMPNGEQGHSRRHRNSKGEHDQTTRTPRVRIVPTNLAQEPRLAPISRRRSIRDATDVERQHRSNEGVDQQEDSQGSGRTHVRCYFASGLPWLSTLPAPLHLVRMKNRRIEVGRTMKALSNVCWGAAPSHRRAGSGIRSGGRPRAASRLLESKRPSTISCGAWARIRTTSVCSACPTTDKWVSKSTSTFCRRISRPSRRQSGRPVRSRSCPTSCQNP